MIYVELFQSPQREIVLAVTHTEMSALTRVHCKLL